VRHLLYALAFSLLVPGALAQDAPKAKRLALVIGNSAYKDVPLPNPVNDSDDVEKVLKESGFVVIKRQNTTLKEMHLALREFGDRLDRQGVGLFYFAGHGMQVRGRNYLIPVDADIQREDEVAYNALDLNAVMEKLDSAKNPVNIVILDACRNNPFGSKFQASSKGLAQVDAPPGTIIAFATAPGSTAADGGGRNGLYTQHLVKEITKAGIGIEEAFKAVRAGVRVESKNLQIPWESTSLESAFVFRPASAQQGRPGSGSNKSAMQRAASTPPAAPPAFQVGDSWTYKLTNNLDQTQRTYTIKIAEVTADSIVYRNGNRADLVGNTLLLKRSDGTEETFSPSNNFYAFPFRIGTSWSRKVVQHIGKRVYDLDIKVSVLGEEEVQTAAGKVRAIKLQRETRWKERKKDNAGTNIWTYWYNGGVKRWVVGEATNTTTTGKVLLNERHELASFDLK
jgi:hypothetical protein